MVSICTAWLKRFLILSGGGKWKYTDGGLIQSRHPDVWLERCVVRDRASKRLRLTKLPMSPAEFSEKWGEVMFVLQFEQYLYFSSYSSWPRKHEYVQLYYCFRNNCCQISFTINKNYKEYFNDLNHVCINSLEEQIAILYRISKRCTSK